MSIQIRARGNRNTDQLNHLVSFRQAAPLRVGSRLVPDFGLAGLHRVVQPTIDTNNMLYKDIHHERMLVLLANVERLPEQTMTNSKFRNLANIVVLELVNMIHDLAIISTNGASLSSTDFVIREQRQLEDDLFE